MTSEPRTPITYASAGVDVEAGDRAVELMKESVRRAMRPEVLGGLGGFAGMLLVGMLGDWFLPFVYNIGLIGFRASVVGWVFLGGVLVIEKHHSALKSS